MVAPACLRRRDRQIVVGGASKAQPAFLAIGANTARTIVQPFLGRKQRLFAGMDADGDDQPVAQA